MNHLTRIQEHLPGVYALAADAIVTGFLEVAALEMEIFQEDLDRMRQTHWIRFVYRLADAAKLGALVGIEPFPWEDLETFRARLLPLVKARLHGALGPEEIKGFVYDYLRASESALSDPESQREELLLPGLSRVEFEEAFAPVKKRPLFRHLELKENPPRLKSSKVLADRGGRVPYLFRWSESNKGLDDSLATFAISGLFGGRTTVPILVNLTTGDLIGYAGPVAFGRTLRVEAAGGENAKATLNDVDVTKRLFSMREFALGTPFSKADLDPQPRLPRLVRGSNDWIFLSVGLYDIKGLNHFFFSIAGENLREGAFGSTSFDQALFPSGPVAGLEMNWIETEPASFEVRVPRFLVIEPSGSSDSQTEAPYQQVARGLESSIEELRAAGVRNEVRFIPFVEVQNHSVRVTLPWVVLDRQIGSAGTSDEFDFGGHFGETTLGRARFE